MGLFYYYFWHCCAAKYLVDDELVGAVGQRSAVLLHQRDEGVAKQLLLPLVFGCGHDNNDNSKTWALNLSFQEGTVKKKTNKDTSCNMDSAGGIMMVYPWNHRKDADAKGSVSCLALDT